MAKIAGGCLCGGVRYTTEAEPIAVGVCHCRDCQKFTGSAFAALLGVPRTALKIDGVIKTFVKTSDGGNPVARHFCPSCGSSIGEEPSFRPGLFIVNIGTLDDPASVTPGTEIYCDRALPWVQLGGMKRFAEMPA